MAPVSTSPVRIDLRAIVGAKNPSLPNIIPAFLFRIVERLIHVRGLNRLFRVLHGKTGSAFLAGALEQLGVTVIVRGGERLMAARHALVVANHPLGGLDGMALMQTVGARLGEIQVPANDLLLNIPQLRDLFIPVNKHGTNVGNLNRFEQAFAGEGAVVHFPAGLCSRDRGGKVRDLTWQKSFIVRARRYSRDVVPVHIDGHNSRFFYGLAKLRKYLGIGFNIEMLFLVDEMFKQKGRVLTLTIGEPVHPEMFDHRMTDWQWARRLRSHVYRLAHNPDARFVP